MGKEKHITSPLTNLTTQITGGSIRPPPQPLYVESVTPSEVNLYFNPSLGLSPLERILLSTNGSLQRVLSAIYNSPISIRMVKNVTSTPVDSSWTVDREINLECHDQVLCVACSTLEISNDEYFDLLITKSVGLGQFFRHIGVLPNFNLISVTKPARPADLERTYTLSCEGIVCTITERFPFWIADYKSSIHK